MNTDFDTMVDAINRLRKEGYSHDFNLTSTCLQCAEPDMSLHPEDFLIDRIFRFDGMTNPDDESILYAISSDKYGIKGILVNAYGLDADPLSQGMIEKLANRF